MPPELFLPPRGMTTVGGTGTSLGLLEVSVTVVSCGALLVRNGVTETTPPAVTVEGDATTFSRPGWTTELPTSRTCRYMLRGRLPLVSDGETIVPVATRSMFGLVVPSVARRNCTGEGSPSAVVNCTLNQPPV